MQSSARIDELRQKFHENPRRYFAPLANEYRKAGDPEQAIAICRAHLAQQPAHMSGHVVYARALYDAGRIDESRVVFEKALSLDPDNAIVLRQLGDISRQKGDSVEARHWYTRALDADPHDREIAAYIAELTEPLTETEVEVPAEPAPVAAPEIPLDIVEAPEPVSETVSKTIDATEIIAEAPAELEPVAEAADEFEPVAEEVEAPEPEPVAEVVEALEPIAPAAEPEEWRPIELEKSPETLEDIQPADAEEISAPAEAEVDIPTQEEPPALTDMPGFEADEALFAADEDVELFPDSTSPFVTRTMADLYAKQGYNDQALEVYRKLAADNPHDQEIAHRIRDLSPADSAPAAEIIAELEAAAPAPAPEKPVHFTDTELGAGDEWDISSWGAGFSAEEAEAEAASVEDDSLATLEVEGLEQFATEPEEVAPLGVFNDAREPSHEELYRPADEPLAAESPLLGVFNDAREESHEELYRPADEPLATEAPLLDVDAVPDSAAESAESEAIAVPEDEEPTVFEPVLEALPTEEPEEAWRPEDAVDTEEVEASPDAETEEGGSEHFVAYAPQPPDEDDLPHYTPVGPTIREFFATLGAYRAPEDAATSFTARAAVPEIDQEPASYEDEDALTDGEPSSPYAESQPADEFPRVTDAFANLFPDSPVSEEDTKAAFALSGALSSQPSQPQARPYPTPQSQAPAVVEPPPSAATQESEEDIRRFREWLDGLADS